MSKRRRRPRLQKRWADQGRECFIESGGNVATAETMLRSRMKKAGLGPAEIMMIVQLIMIIYKAYQLWLEHNKGKAFAEMPVNVADIDIVDDGEENAL